MTFQYRFVNFGTKFIKGSGTRAAGDRFADPSTLYSNEIAMDVGGECFGYNGCTLPIFDHHFVREGGQYSSATLTVLDLSAAVRAAVGSQDVVWLVTHSEPDFDAFCSMYAARVLLTEAIPDSVWAGANPLNPDGRRFPVGLAKEHRWLALLGVYASMVDNCRRVLCRKERALHSILYAALERGRDYRDVDSGALEFFEQARAAMVHGHLNPLYDSVLEGNAVFAPELAMLDREVLAYERDVRRARKTLVHLATWDGPFATFFDSVKNVPLASRPREFGGKRSQADGIYLRDPECILFKEWARMDTDNSSMGEGYLFTAVAYSSGRASAEVNSSNYYFSVDPERSAGRHLYDVWECLEREEMLALQQSADYPKLRETGEARLGFEARGGSHAFLLDDPWFDGHNYECTIVATPNRGSYIAAAGHRGDLADDKVTRIVARCLEHSIYSGPVVVRDLNASARGEDAFARQVGMGDTVDQLSSPAKGEFRLAMVPLEENVDLDSGAMLPQVATALWKVLNPAVGAKVPAGFLDTHVFCRQGWMAVWSREGLGVAFKEAARAKADQMQVLFRRVIQFMGDANEFIYASSESDRALALTRGEGLIRTGAQLMYEAALPDNEVLQKFLEASRLNEVVGILRDLQAAGASGAQLQAIAGGTDEMVKLQKKVEVLELVIVSFYATELMRTFSEYLELSGVASLGLSLAGVAVITAVIWYAMTRTGSIVRIFAVLALLWILVLAGSWLIPREWPWMLKTHVTSPEK